MGARVPIRGSLSGRGRLAYSDGEATEAVGMSREGAYSKVQEHAMLTWREGGSFLERLQGDAAVTGLVSAETLAGMFEPWRYLKHVPGRMEAVMGPAED